MIKYGPKSELTMPKQSQRTNLLIISCNYFIVHFAMYNWLTLRTNMKILGKYIFTWISIMFYGFLFTIQLSPVIFP